MGLDMYLHAERYYARSAWASDENRQTYNRIIDLVDAAHYVDPHWPSLHVSILVGYWRKANHIHHWFVNNVQDGRDDCGRHYVHRSQLYELYNICKDVLAHCRLVRGQVLASITYTHEGQTKNYIDGLILEDSRYAREHLPTSDGPFFGSTEYNEQYVNSIKDTIRIIERALKTPDEWEFYYEASW